MIPHALTGAPRRLNAALSLKTAQMRNTVTVMANVQIAMPLAILVAPMEIRARVILSQAGVQEVVRVNG